MKLTTEKFIKKARLVHGDKYEYFDEYVNAKTKYRIICKEHGEFWQRSNNHLYGRGCKKCINSRTSTKEFIKKARLVHGDRYDYSKVEYINAHTKVIIICKKHGDFKQTPNAHTTKNQGCKKCGGKQQTTTKEFIQRASLIHNNKYDYSKVEYVNAHTKVIIICKEHGNFEQIANDHLNGSGCNKCSCFNYSQKSINWLNKIAKEQNIYIQHAENEGEYQISGTRYKADGYCKETKTIYEFYGDIWHGNLNLFEEQDQCHPFTDECAGSLYVKTINREEEIKKLGYNLITIWENEYDNTTPN